MLHNSCNVGSSDLSDVYTLIPQAYGPHDAGCTYQTTSTHVTITKCTAHCDVPMLGFDRLIMTTTTQLLCGHTLNKSRDYLRYNRHYIESVQSLHFLPLNQAVYLAGFL